MFRFPAPFLMQFETLIPNILWVFVSKFENNWINRHFESKFWSILTVSVILCGVQSTRWSCHLIRAKYCLFTSFSCVKHIFCGIVCTQRPFVFEDFHRQGTTDWLVGAGAQNYLEVVIGYWSKNSKLLWARAWFCHPGLVISVIIQYRITTMTTYPT